MTLLILPLMESVGDAAAHDLTTLEWLDESAALLFSFALSFVLIANFWLTHHRLFAGVHRVTNGLLWLTIAWMFTIVWLPIATSVRRPARSGRGAGDPLHRHSRPDEPGDVPEPALRARHPQLHDIPESRLRSGLTADLVTLVLFLLALAVALVFPVVNYWAMFLLLLTAPLHRLVARRR